MLLAAGGLDLLAELVAELFEIDLGQELPDGLGAHAGAEALGSELLLILPILPIGEDLLLLQGGLTGIDDHESGEIQHLLQGLGAHVQKHLHPAGDALEVPDMAHRHGELDMSHPLPADLGAGDLNAALLADDALIAAPLVAAAVALPVLGGSEDTLAEQAVPLGLQRAVVDGFGLLYLAVRPFHYLLGGSKADLQRVKISEIKHSFSPLPSLP